MAKRTRDEAIDGLTRAVRAYQAAVDAMDEAVCVRMGVNRTDGRCLDILDQRGPMTAGKLARESGLSPGAVTSVLDRLEHAGYARRIRDAEDRRRVLVEMTDKAREETYGYYRPIGEAGREMLKRFSVDQLDLFTEFLDGSRELTDRVAAGVRGHSA